MLHINQWLWEQDLLSKIKSIIAPEYYQAFSIKDFLDDILDDKVQILPTRKVWPLAVFYFGEAVVHFPSVAYTYKNTGPTDAEISDGITTLDVKLSQDMRVAINRGNLIDGDKLYSVRVQYNPKSGAIRIKDYETTGPKSPDRNKEPESLPKLEGSLSPA